MFRIIVLSSEPRREIVQPIFLEFFKSVFIVKLCFGVVHYFIVIKILCCIFVQCVEESLNLQIGAKAEFRAHFLGFVTGTHLPILVFRIRRWVRVETSVIVIVVVITFVVSAMCLVMHLFLTFASADVLFHMHQLFGILVDWHYWLFRLLYTK